MSTRRSVTIKKFFRIYIDEEGLQTHKQMIGGLIAFSLIIVQAFISTKIGDAAEWISVISFAIAIPLLVMFILGYGGTTLPRRTTIFEGALWWVGFLIDICGLDAAFWHVSWIAGLLFIVSGLLAFGVYLNRPVGSPAACKKLRREQPQPPPST